MLLVGHLVLDEELDLARVAGVAVMRGEGRDRDLGIELGLLTLEEAVHKMTGMPARTLRIADRGLLRAGTMADVVEDDAAGGAVRP